VNAVLDRIRDALAATGLPAAEPRSAAARSRARDLAVPGSLADLERDLAAATRWANWQ
jgi:hypothetical protein